MLGYVAVVNIAGEVHVTNVAVVPEYRRRGLGLSLERYVIRQEVRRGHIPFCQMFDDNDISLHLQQKAGMELHPQPIWWLLPHT